MIRKICFLYPLIIALSIVSCSRRNPIGPVIKQTWGTYDYFSYGLYENWEYIEVYPNVPDTVNYWLYCFGQEYIKPYNGWQIGIIINGVPTHYYYLDASTSEAVYNSNPYGRVWWLMYELPFVKGNEWHSETIYLDFDGVEWKREFNAKVVGRGDMSVIAGDYKDCVEILVSIKDSIVDTANGDSSYSRVIEEWFAPNVGEIKWVVTKTDVEDWKGAYGVLTKRYHRIYNPSSYGFQFWKAKKINSEMGFPIYRFVKAINGEW